ncbi:MAG: restriction endonuclease subunit S [Gammaproteobacteria bacterium]
MHKNLIDIVSIRAGYPFRGRIETETQGNAQLVQMRDLDPEGGLDWATPVRVNVEDTGHPAFLLPDDILFVNRGAHFFATLLATPPADALAAPHLFILRVKNTAQVWPAYLAWYLNHRRAQHYFQQHTKGTSIPSISRKALETLPVLLPPLDTQQHIGAVDRCWRAEKKLQRELLEKREEWLETVLDRLIDN